MSLRLALLCIITTLVGCGQAPDSALRRGNIAEPSTLDPHRSEGVSSGNILRDLYEGLVAEGADGSLQPGAAARWEISEDGRTYRFYLRNDGRWSNGDPLVADDFVAGIRRTVDPQTRSGYAPSLAPIINASEVTAGELPVEQLGVRAIDPLTVEIQLQRPTPYFLGLLTNSPTYPLHRASFDALGDAFVKPGNMVSNGAYELESWRIGDRLVVKRNANYRDADKVAIERVEFLPIEDTANELNLFRAGDLDITSNAPGALYQDLKNTYGDRFLVAPNLSVYFLVFDMSEPPFDDIRLREALTRAVDRDDIANVVLGAGQLGAWGLVPPGVTGYESFSYAWRDHPRDEQLAAARALYAQAGYNADTPLSAELIYNTSDNHKKIAVAVQAMLRENLGAAVTVINQEFKVMLQNRNQRENWDLLRLGWTGDYNDANTFLEIFRSDHPQNTSTFADPQFDAMLDAANRELDPARRSALLAQAEARVMQQYPVLPLYFYVSKRLVAERVAGFQPNIMNRIYSRHLSLR
ncbi:MAG: peptide ABC transporter substrate-binding protein [Pseudomonadota bacterium]